ncbi:MAG: hypothetical protein QOK47_768, partial [Actinomycetota bacterium]|nr:hypothetical protein [Actinomycetota bacterium]
MKRALLIVLLVAGSCAPGSDRPAPTPSEAGPPDIQFDVVARHAEQFNIDIGSRPAGSQEEFATATYITGHLQQAGYTARLDAVPVADTVKSTNVIALAPSGSPEVVVAIPYDTEPGSGADYGTGLGLFLELARALHVRDPDHSVAFVALGAERTDVNGGSLGSRRLAQFLVDEELDPMVVSILEVAPSSPPSLTVLGAPEICRVADQRCVDAAGPEDVYERAGFV